MVDLIVIGGGGAGMMASITAKKQGKSVLLIEKLSTLGAKLKATGGGKCNLTNTLEREAFIQRFGRNGRFMQEALKSFSNHDLIDFFQSIGVPTHSPDGYRIFPVTHHSMSILKALNNEIKRLGVETRLNEAVISINKEATFNVTTSSNQYQAHHLIIATGGLGYPTLGTTGDGYHLASKLEHTITPLYPAMLPLRTEETWVANCRADTIPKVTMKIDLKKYRKLQALGDLIFTKNGIRGPVVLDFAREITPLLEESQSVPILLNFTQGMNGEQIAQHLKTAAPNHKPMIDILTTLLPQSLALELLKLADIEPHTRYKETPGLKREALIKLLVWTPLTIIGSEGFDRAMITRGGVSLKEIDPYTMQSKKLEGLYFCGEVIDIDGPCGGYNLQWSFSSGFLAGKLLKS